MMPTSPHDFVESIPLMQYQLTAIMRKTHPLASKTKLTFQDLQKQKLILPEKGIRDRNAIESYIHAETGDLNVHSLINDANAILNIVQESNFIGILADHTISNRPSLCSIPIEELTKPIQVYAHYNKDSNLKHSAEEFIKTLKQTSAYYMANNS